MAELRDRFWEDLPHVIYDKFNEIRYDDFPEERECELTFAYFVLGWKAAFKSDTDINKLTEAISLLKLFMANKPLDWKPGAWDYDKEGAELVESVAKFLGISDPWKNT